MATSSTMSLSFAPSSLSQASPSTSFSAFLSRRLSRIGHKKAPLKAFVRSAVSKPGASKPLKTVPVPQPSSVDSKGRRRSASRPSSAVHVSAGSSGAVTASAASSPVNPSQPNTDVNWLSAGYSSSSKVIGAQRVQRGSISPRRRSSATASSLLAEAEVDASCSLSRKKKKSRPRANSRDVTCEAATTCFSAEEAVLASDLSFLYPVPFFVPSDDQSDLRGVQDLLEQSWLLPSTDDMEDIEEKEDADATAGPGSSAHEGVNVEAFMGQVLTGRRMKSGRRKESRKDLHTPSLAVPATSGPAAGPSAAPGDVLLPQQEGEIASDFAYGEVSADGETLQGQEPLISFPTALELKQAKVCSSRRSVDLGRRVLVRSMRKRRLSLGSRVGVIKGSVGPLQQVGPVAVQNTAEITSDLVAEVKGRTSQLEASADKVLKGYGWKGSYFLEWDPARRVLTPEQEQDVLGFLESWQEVKNVQAMLSDKLSRPPTPSEVAQELQCTVAEVAKMKSIFHAAKNKLVMHNLPLVVSIAKKYMRIGYGVDFASLCQRGVRGLFAAAERFSSKRKCRFATFATICVRTVITREIASSMHVRAPTYTSYKFMLLQKAELEMEKKLNRKPSDLELATEIKVGVAQVKVLRKLFLKHPVLLHQDVKGLGVQLAEIVPDPDGEKGTGGGADATVWEVDFETVRYALDDVIDSLRPKEAVVIRQRFGLDGYGERSLADIGKNLSLSRQMVLKYEKRAMAKLQLPERAALFQTYLEDYN